MKLTDLPSDILSIILLDAKDLKYLLNYNNNLDYTIECMFKRFTKKFYNINKNWQNQMQNLIEILIFNNDTDSLKFLINNYYNQIDFYTLLIKSSELNNLDVITLINIDDEYKYHKIATTSARNGHLDLTKWAFSKITSTSCKVKTILHVADNAARNKNQEIINWALEKGCGYDFIAYGAAKGGHFDLVIDSYLKGDVELNWIAYGANKYRHYGISNWAIEMGANDFVLIASGFVHNVYQ